MGRRFLLRPHHWCVLFVFETTACSLVLDWSAPPPSTMSVDAGGDAKTEKGDGGASDAGFCERMRGAEPAPFFRCLDFDDSGDLPGRRGASGVTFRADVDDGPSPPNALSIRVAPLGEGEASYGMVWTDMTSEPKSAELAFEMRVDVPRRMSLGLLGADTSAWNLYMHYDNGLLDLEESWTPADGGATQYRSHEMNRAVDLSVWHRFEARVSFTSAQTSLRIDGVDQPLGAPTVFHVPRGASTYNFTPGLSVTFGPMSTPLVIHLDNVVMRASL